MVGNSVENDPTLAGVCFVHACMRLARRVGKSLAKGVSAIKIAKIQIAKRVC